MAIHFYFMTGKLEINSLECGGLTPLSPVATRCDYGGVLVFKESASSRLRPKRRQAGALQRLIRHDD
jgi:hypothetical protein